MNAILIAACVVVALAVCCFVMRSQRIMNNKIKNGKPRVEAKGDYKVTIPEEQFVVADIQLNESPLVGVFNTKILDVEPKIVFRWYLSIAIDFAKTVGDNMPDDDDIVRMQDFGEELDRNIKNDEDHPNAVFLGRLTGDSHTEMMWYVNNPEMANTYLQNLISSGEYPFEFDFEMYEDPDWKEASYWIDPLLKK